MTRLHVVVEGDTEENFVNKLLAPHLYQVGYIAVSARLMGRQRPRRRRGGVRPWPETRRDIVNRLRGDSGIIVSTFVDYYGMPCEGPGVWPGRAETRHLPVPEKSQNVELAMLDDLTNEMGPSFNTGRFIPYVMMHEFEAMLFSDCETFAQAIGRTGLAGPFQQIRDGFPTSEHINDSSVTAPSKRIEALLPGYQKPLLGVLAASEIGLPAIREECTHFGEWLSRLEGFPVRHA